MENKITIIRSFPDQDILWQLHALHCMHCHCFLLPAQLRLAFLLIPVMTHTLAARFPFMQYIPLQSHDTCAFYSGGSIESLNPSPPRPSPPPAFLMSGCWQHLFTCFWRCFTVIIITRYRCRAFVIITCTISMQAYFNWTIDLTKNTLLKKYKVVSPFQLPLSTAIIDWNFH